MMWLYIYVGTVVFYWVSFITLGIELSGYANRENLIVEPKSVGENFAGLLKSILISLIPILNLILGFMFLLSDSLRTSAIRKMKPKDSETSWNEFNKD